MAQGQAVGGGVQTVRVEQRVALSENAITLRFGGRLRATRPVANPEVNVLIHELAFVCPHVFDGSRPVLLVIREGGDWQFLCGGDHDESEGPRVVGISHLIERDDTLRDVLDLADDWEAERPSAEGEWERNRCKPEDYERPPGTEAA